VSHKIIALIAGRLLAVNRIIEIDNAALLEPQFGDDAVN